MNERLEEIINDITFVAKSYNGVEPLIEYAKEQDELVEDLEKQILYRDSALESASKITEKLAEENKRYSDAIEYAISESGWGNEGSALLRTISILEKALEED